MTRNMVVLSALLLGGVSMSLVGAFALEVDLGDAVSADALRPHGARYEVVAPFFWTGRYAMFEGLQPKDQVVVEFPVIETKETYTVKWKKTDFWREGTDPGKNWKNDHPETFTLTFKGNTLIDVEPRAKDAAYPCFERDDCKAAAAPMHKVSRFVSEVNLHW